MTDPGIQSRLQYQEKVTEDLAKQLKAIKALLHNEVTEIKSSLAEQMTEMKQIVMHQDRLYQERIRRLETRVEQISEFSLHLARSKGVGGLSHALTEKALVEEEEGQSALEPVAEPHSGNEKLEEDDETERLPGVRGVLQRYRNKIRNVYSFYTSYQASRPLAQVMDMTQFTRMAKDCGLTNSLNGPNNNNNHHNYSVEGTYQWMANLPPPEILWMAVMRRLDKKILRFHKSHPYLGKIPVALDPTAPLNRFSIERHLDLPLEFFPEALVVLSEVKYGKERVDMTPEQILERFLNSDIFPNVDLRASEEYVASSTDPFRQVSAAVTAGATLDASLIQNYASDEVKEELKPYLSKIKATYFSYVRKPKNISLAGRPKDPEAIPNMFLETFVDVIKDHGLFPFISKADIRIIYNTARKAGGNKGAESEDASPHSRRGGRSSTTVESKPLDYVATEVDEGLSIGQFKIALKYLAERIYGAALYHEKYPTPAHRMKKLLSKLYLLTNM